MQYLGCNGSLVDGTVYMLSKIFISIPHMPRVTKNGYNNVNIVGNDNDNDYDFALTEWANDPTACLCYAHFLIGFLD